ncbi:MAG TPA: alpha/beta hydrolase [Legionella sp.]|nr:alpha/beta hydrolase [Legionella sp.]
MRSKVFRLLKLALIIIGIFLITLISIRAFDSQRGAPLKLWHTYVPKEIHKKDLEHMDWQQYIHAENKVFNAVEQEVTRKLPRKDRIASNRYYSKSPMYPPHLSTNWNHSYILEPQGTPLGAVVLLHGLTDSPYSLRHIARRYREYGYLVVAIRLPAHGTVPAALTDVTWEDWMAATRLAVREASNRVGPGKPLHLVGFSNGGALALKYALDAIEQDKLTRPDKIILISPMIGITRFARFAGLAGLPALLPAFAKAAWLSVLPEFNPFKYNSFPINAARQSHRLTISLQQQIVKLAQEKRLNNLAPVLTFQSIVDFTVSTRAIISAFYTQLPANGSELVLFDINRASHLALLLRPSAKSAVTRYLNKPPRLFRTTILTNATNQSEEVIEQLTEANSVKEKIYPTGLYYPRGIYSLSHVAIPFPMSDGLYGLNPDPQENYGIQLGNTATRGERNVLIMSLDGILRLSSNPFFAYMIKRIGNNIAPEQIRAVAKADNLTSRHTNS